MQANCLILLCSRIGVDVAADNRFLILISQTKNRIDLAEKDDQDQVEEQEYPEIIYDIVDHYNNGGKHGEYPQKEECLCNEQKHNNAHHDPRRNVEWPQVDLHDHISNGPIDIENIRIVPYIPEVIHASSDHLSEIVESWVKDAHGDGDGVDCLLVIYNQVCILDVNNQDKRVKHMHCTAEHVVLPAIRVPFVLDDLLETWGVEYL